MTASGQPGWQQQRERGAGLGIALLFWLSHRLGRRLTLWIALLPLLWFFCSGRGARAAVADYLQRLQGHAASLRQIWRQFYRFTEVAVDRIFLLAGRGQFQNEMLGAELVDDCLAQGGALLLVAHFGSFEAMRVVGARQRQLPIAILMDRAHGAKMTAAFERVAPELAAHVIDAADGGPQLVLKLREALAAGKLVGLMADRARDGEPTIAVPFLGSTAHFPANPWLLAMALKCPVILGFSVALGEGRYRSSFELFSAGLTGPRGERQALLQRSVAGYAARLEQQVRQAPDNWFNFYPFWAAPSGTGTDDAAPH